MRSVGLTWYEYSMLYPEQLRDSAVDRVRVRGYA